MPKLLSVQDKMTMYMCIMVVILEMRLHDEQCMAEWYVHWRFSALSFLTKCNGHNSDIL